MARHSGGGAGVLVAGRHQNGVGVGRGARGARRHFGGGMVQEKSLSVVEELKKSRP